MTLLLKDRVFLLFYGQFVVDSIRQLLSVY